MFSITPRLTLRPGWPEDAEALANAIGREEVVRHLARAPWPYGRDDAEAFLALSRGAAEPRFQIIERSGDYRMIGGIGLHREGHGWEIGYWLAPEAWGKGYATEAGRAVLAIARDALGFERLGARHHVDNPASGRVLRKLGFEPVGEGEFFSVAQGRAVPCLTYTLALRAPASPAAVSLAA